MDSKNRLPRKARKSVRNASPNIVEPTTDVSSSLCSNTIRKSARKSTGPRSLITNNFQTTQPVPNTVRSSVGVSQDTTLSLPSCSRDSDIQPRRSRRSVANSLNSTVSFSQPGCSRDPESFDSDVLPTSTQKIPTCATRTSKNHSVFVSSPSPPSTSEESDIEEMLKKTASKGKAKAGKSLLKNSVSAGNSSVDPSNLMSQCVFYILVANRSKRAIKKKDIIKNVFEGRNTHLFPEIIKKAASMIQRTFGFELMELKDSKNEYLLVNNLSHQYEIHEFTEYSRMELQKQGFIFYILTLIFMNENSILEEDLWKALEPLGVEIRSRKPHPIFGDVLKFVNNTLVKQMYLERRQLLKDPPQFEFIWGERAHKEVLKEDLLEFACQIMPNTRPEEWILQYKDAKGRPAEDEAEVE